MPTTSPTASAASASTSTAWGSLSDDLVLDIAGFLPPAVYAQLRCVSRHLRGLLDATPGFLARRRGAPPDVVSLEQLAVHEFVRAILSLQGNRLTFEGASTELRAGQKGMLAHYATLLRRFPRVRLHIDAHTGPNAPPTFAPSFTRERAETVVCELLALDASVRRERLGRQLAPNRS